MSTAGSFVTLVTTQRQSPQEYNPRFRSYPLLFSTAFIFWPNKLTSSSYTSTLCLILAIYLGIL